MKVFLSAVETNPSVLKYFDHFHYMLMSYFYVKEDTFKKVVEMSEAVMMDSGAHSFQKGKQVDWVEYTKEYAAFIKKNDSPKVIGYFEMDVDNIIGYDKVLELRSILEAVSDKIIPVWHKNRGIPEFIKMCQDYAGKWIAVTGFKNEDIKDEQYEMFYRTAKKYGCKIHCLGMTRTKVLDRIPFDAVDSSSWKQHAIFGRVGKKKVARHFSKTNITEVMAASLIDAIKMQEKYARKWRRYDK